MASDTTAKPDHRLRWRLAGVVVFLLVAAIPWIIDGFRFERSSIFVPSEDAVIAKMFELAKVTKDDVLFDLGCGDGRILIEAAKKFGCKTVGVEFNPIRFEEAKERLRRSDVDPKLVDLRLGDAFAVPDIERATVVTLYVLPEFMAKVEQKIVPRLKPGTRIVAHDYPMPTLPPDREVDVETGYKWTKAVYLWTIREKPRKKPV